MSRVVVEVRDGETGRAAAFAFERFPIRVGRNELNDLVLDFPFVSDFHGVLRQRATDGGALFFVDVGATNPTRVDGKPAERHQPVPVAAGTRVQIGALELTLADEGATVKAGGQGAAGPLAASGDERAVFAAASADEEAKAGQPTVVLAVDAEPPAPVAAAPAPAPPVAAADEQGDILRELTEASRLMNAGMAAGAEPLPRSSSPAPVSPPMMDAGIVPDVEPLPPSSPPAPASPPIVADGGPPAGAETGARVPQAARPSVVAGGTRLVDRSSFAPRPAPPAAAGGTKVLDAAGESVKQKLAALLEAQQGPVERGDAARAHQGGVRRARQHCRAPEGD
jgi:predicted component of type VI protein secretion system